MKSNPPREALEFVQAMIEAETENTAQEVAERLAFVYLTPWQLFKLWFASLKYHLRYWLK